MDTTLTQARGALARSEDGWSAPVLQPRNGPIERVAVRIGTGHPVLVFLGAMLTGLALIATVSIALGLLVTRVLLHVDGVSANDAHFVRCYAAYRHQALTNAPPIGSRGSGG